MAFISDTHLNISDVVIDGNWDFSLVRTSIPPQFLDGLQRAYWSPPPHDVIKGNVDGSFFPDSKRMRVGGLFRDNNKQWLGGFSGYVGCGNALEAELLAVLSALQFAWSQGWRNLILESDSMEVVTLWSLDAGSSFHQHLGLIQAISSFRSRAWTVEFTHVYREGNQPADLLARQGALGVHQVLWLDDPPTDVSTLILWDAVSYF
ncbi:Ribonuclease H domain [Sesbania bispinosa]|nr:Ribonuclease H domain [Sesbania bispinosa]